MAAWYALRTRSNFEFSVRDSLRDQGIAEFVPVYEERTRWSDRERRTIRPLLTGYVLARFDLEKRIRVLNTRGVVEILSIDRNPVPIPEEEIAELRRIAESPSLISPCPHVAAGERVRVERGPFEGIEGIVVAVKGERILTIPVDILGRSVAVQIDRGDVKRERRRG